MRWLTLSILAAGAFGGCLPSGRSVPLASAPAIPRPYRQRLSAAIELNATCIACHEKEAAEWRGSLHQRAYVNAAFEEALAIEPTPFCRGCHAPESDPRVVPDRAVSELGVGCVTCHVVGSERHPARRRSELGPNGACAGCHEFRFPGAPADDDAHNMQTTAREHRRSVSASRSCTSCHMPRGSHAFRDVRDPSWLKAQLRVTAEHVGHSHGRLTLVQTDPGHAFPTGDLFRRIEVRWEERDAGGQVVRREVRHLARHFELSSTGARQLIDDDRIFDEPRVVEMSFSPSSTSVAWWITYQRVAQVGGGNPAETKIESEVPLHSGTLSLGKEE